MPKRRGRRGTNNRTGGRSVAGGGGCGIEGRVGKKGGVVGVSAAAGGQSFKLRWRSSAEQQQRPPTLLELHNLYDKIR